jgi:hypothetical protein
LFYLLKAGSPVELWRPVLAFARQRTVFDHDILNDEGIDVLKDLVREAKEIDGSGWLGPKGVTAS